MDSERERLSRALAELEDDLATARAALNDGEFETLEDITFSETLRRCIPQSYISNRDFAVQTVVGRGHLLRTEHIPNRDADAIEACLDEFEDIARDIRRLNEPFLMNG